MPTPPIALSLGDRFDLGPELGRGTMGVVHRVFDRALGQDVAAKFLAEADPDLLFHLKREFRELATLSHPNLVQLYELVQVGDIWLLTMEWIDGQSLDRSTVRHGAIPDLAQQASEGLSYLHDNGKLHRDLKPGNLLLDGSGRLLLADFGLTSAAERSPALGGAIPGTLYYAAPELIENGITDEATDWFALGVCLAEFATGESLFPGPLAAALLSKRNGLTPRQLSAIERAAGDIAPPLAALITGSPETRIKAAERLADREGPVGNRRNRDPFVGRKPEIRALEDALAATWEGETRVLEVIGESGIGKTALVSNWTQSAMTRSSRPFVVRGRCQQRESVALRALDPLIDDFSEVVLRSDELELESVLEPDTSALVSLFPVLGRLRGISSRATTVDGEDPDLLRSSAIRSLARLFAGVSQHRPIVLWVDDAQWGDADSALLLSAILGAPGARILLVVSHRSETSAGALMEDLRSRVDAHFEPIVLEGLGDSECRQLAGILSLPENRLPEGDLRGSPYFIVESSRWAESGATHVPNDLIGARLDALSTEDRIVVEAAAMSQGDVPASVILRAAEIPERDRARLYSLCARGLLRSVGGGGLERVRIDHDRLRDNAQLQARERADSIHRDLAEAWEQEPNPDPEVLLEHHLGAGNRVRAAAYAETAAARAESTFAFHRSAELLELSFNLQGRRDEDAELLTRSAEAWRRSGQGKRSANAFIASADASERTGGDDFSTLGLRSQAAGQLLTSGRLNEGLAIMRSVLDRFGVQIPSSPTGAVLQSLWHRLLFVAKGIPSDIAPPRPASREEQALVDALSEAARGTAMQQHVMSDLIGVRLLRNTLASHRNGLPRMLAMEAAVESTLGGRFFGRRSERLLELAQRIADRSGEPKQLADVAINRAAVAWFKSDWPRCKAESLRAYKLYELHSPGSAWELDICNTFLFGALGELGEVADLCSRSDEFLERARSRGDDTALHLHHSAQLALVPLARDRSEEALISIDRAAEIFSNTPFASQKFTQLMERTRIHLYRGEGQRAHELVENAWPDLRKAGILRSDGMGLQMRYLRAVAALHRLEAEGAASKDSLLAVAGREIRTMSKSSLPNAAPFADAIHAGVAFAKGNDPREHVESAAKGFAAVAMEIHRAALHIALERRPDEIDTVRSQGVADPEQFARIFAPPLTSW